MTVYAMAGVTYRAYDSQLRRVVAVKEEKLAKPKQVLMIEYETLQALQGLPCICRVYDFIRMEENKPNRIVMQLLGSSLARLRNQNRLQMTRDFSCDLLVRRTSE